MSRVCTVCTHQELEAIDRALVQSTPNRRIAAQYSLQESSIRRHKAEHLPAAMAQAKQAAVVAHGESLVDQVRALRERAMTLLDKAEQASKLRDACSAIREARGCLELEARMSGELNPSHTTNNIVVAGDDVKEKLLERLMKLSQPSTPAALPAPTVEKAEAPMVIDMNK